MLVGKIFYSKHYAWYKYVSVVMICLGISLFTSAKSKPKDIDRVPAVDNTDMWSTLFGLLLVTINLSLDGVTSNEQDRIFAEYNATSLQMMQNTNCWQAIYLSIYLTGNYILKGNHSSIYKAIVVLLACPQLKYDIFGFCLCACFGQILLFGLIREFGSLVWITVSVTRQLFTILISVFMFRHPVNMIQWGGVVSVFGGLGFEIFFSYRNQLVKNFDAKETDSGCESSDVDSNYGDELSPSVMIKKHL